MSLAVCFLALASCGADAADAREEGREAVIVCGGPALRFFEEGKEASHDFFWGNFIVAAQCRIRQLQQTMRPGDRITWLVFRPGYRQRGEEMSLDLLADIVERADAYGVRLLWFDTRGQLVNYLNKGRDRRQVPLYSFDYFGHSNKACFLFDYSNDVDGMSTMYLHEKDLDQIQPDIFARGAVSKSWGCHSGESYSAAWKRRFSVPMEGAVGKTDYATGGLPALSNKEGAWVQ